MTSQIELSAGTLDYEDTGGDGPVLVLLSGLMMDASLWEDVIAGLSPAHRCVCPRRTAAPAARRGQMPAALRPPRPHRLGHARPRHATRARTPPGRAPPARTPARDPRQLHAHPPRPARPPRPRHPRVRGPRGPGPGATIGPRRHPSTHALWRAGLGRKSGRP